MIDSKKSDKIKKDRKPLLHVVAHIGIPLLFGLIVVLGVTLCPNPSINAHEDRSLYHPGQLITSVDGMQLVVQRALLTCLEVRRSGGTGSFEILYEEVKK